MPKTYLATLLAPCEEGCVADDGPVLPDVSVKKFFPIWLFQVSLMGSQKFFLILVAVTILDGWEAELEMASFISV